MAKKAAFLLAIIFFIISFVFCVIGYGTGYWFEAEGEGRLFRRLGLWEACFDGYEHTSDYIGKAYYGCWWIFHKEYSYIRDWILPPWFKAVQTLMTFALVLQFVGLGVLPLAGNEDAENLRMPKLSTGITIFCALCLGISVTMFGIMVGEDRTWMPRPDEDALGWSFGMAVVSAFFATFSAISMTVYYLMRKYDELPKDQVDMTKSKRPMMPMHMVPKV